MSIREELEHRRMASLRLPPLESGHRDPLDALRARRDAAPKLVDYGYGMPDPITGIIPDVAEQPVSPPVARPVRRAA